MFDCFVFFFVLSLFSERFVLTAASVLHFTYFYGYYSQSSLVATKNNGVLHIYFTYLR